MKQFSTRFFAHRGLHGQPDMLPENSITAFRKAVGKGYGIELDVRLTKDSLPVVFHDDTLERVCGIPGRICDYTYEELKEFSLYQSAERIPLLSEVLAMVNGQVPLLAEIKMDRLEIRVCEETAALFDHYSGDFGVESFHPYVVYWFRRNRPLVYRGQLYGNASRSDTIPRWQWILLQTQITNIWTKPHFVAYDHRCRKSLPCRFWKWRKPSFGWVFRSQEELQECRDDFDYYIVEHTYTS